MKTLLVITALLITIGCQKQAREILRPETNTIKVEKPSKKYREKQLMVRFKNGANNKLRIKERVFTKHMERRGEKPFDIIEVDDVEKSLAELQKNPNVEMVSPNYIRTVPDINVKPQGLNNLIASTYPNDPGLPDLWGMKAINAQTAWDAGAVGDTSVIVGLIDEGIKFWHDDLRCVVWTNPFDPVDGIDNDGNGYVDDIHGWDWFNGDNSIFDNRDFHGTHTAGTIGATGNNAKGVIGVCPQVKIISLKFLESWGDDMNAIKAFDYIADLKVRHNLKIVNTSNSWGGGGYNPFLYEAIKRNGDVQIQAFCAAGNSNENNDVVQSPNYPSSYDLDCITAVAASDWGNNKAGFSSYGAVSVDLAAPGTGILSCYQGDLFQTNQYIGASGTSMATPHCAGADALLTASRPTLTIAQRKEIMLNSVTPVAAWNGLVKTGGVLNISSFTTPTQIQLPGGCLEAPPDLDNIPPTIPDGLELLSVAAGRASFKWRKGSDNVAVEHYLLTMGSYLFGTTDTTITVNGLNPGSYTCFVQAKDKWGNISDPTNSVIANIPGDEENPTPPNIYYYTADETSITCVFTVGTDNIGIKNNLVFWREKDGVWNSFEQSNVTFVFTLSNLRSGVEHEIFMRSVDWSNNQSEPSNRVFVSTSGATEPPPPPPPPPPVGDTISPLVTILSPSDGYQIPMKGNRNVKINFTATDNIGVTGRQIIIDGVVVATNVSNYTWNANKASPGSHVITCKAFDASGNIGIKSVTVLKK